ASRRRARRPDPGRDGAGARRVPVDRLHRHLRVRHRDRRPPPSSRRALRPASGRPGLTSPMPGAAPVSVVRVPTLGRWVFLLVPRPIRLFYLAIMTMAFGELLRWIYIRAEPLTNGSMGLAVPPPVLLGLRLSSDRSKFYVFLVLVVVVVLLTSSLLRSRFGR